MTFSFIYALLENMWPISFILCIITGLTSFVCMIARLSNELDRDDYMLIMPYILPVFIITLVIVFMPGVDHVRSINDAINVAPTFYPH